MEEKNQADHHPLVVAVVLTWNDTEMAGQCIGSVLANDYDPLRVVLVDNGSVNPCGEQLRQQFPSIDLVVLPKNQGFTGGCNRGLERALQMGAEYIFLLNNDTIVDRLAIRHLVDAIKQRPDAAAASALILFPDEEKRVMLYTGRLLRDCGQHIRPPEGQLYANSKWPTVETEFASACALLFRSSVLREVGLFDESLGTCWEDYDLCVRFMDAKRPIIAVGDAEVIHDRGSTTGRASPYITYYFTRNRLICLFRHGRPWAILRNTPYILRSFWSQVKAYGLGNWRCHCAFVKAVFHFLLGVRGEGRPPRARAD